jgi:TonB family protein
MRSIAVIAALVTGLSAVPSAIAAADLGEAKVLYGNASYDEAIQELNAIHDAAEANQVDQYLALCLLALGKPGEAEHPLEEILAREPLYALDQVDTSPKLLDLFHQVRRRVLPAAALDAYSRGRADYEAKRFSAAVEQFKRLIEISNDPESGDSVGALKQLGDGFLTLSKAALTPAAPVASAVPSSVPASIPPTASVTPRSLPDDPDRIYTSADAGVVPPKPIDRQLPPWDPPDHALARREFRGALTVVINERGAVESASVPASVTPEYDRALLAAAKQWKFRAATKDDKPVKFVTTIEVLLQPAQK